MNREGKISVLTVDDFQSHLNHTFSVKVNDRVLELTLSKCETTPQFTDSRFREPFRLIFVSKNQTALSQGNYSIHCQSLGTLNLFLVPIAIGKYEAIFN